MSGKADGHSSNGMICGEYFSERAEQYGSTACFSCGAYYSGRVGLQ